MKTKLLLTIAFIHTICSVQAQTPSWQWAKGVGGATGEVAYAICNDPNGNLYVTGLFSSPTLTFGSITLINPDSSKALFIVKYNSSGNVIWARGTAGKNANTSGNDIQTDAEGNFYVTGYFADTLVLGSIALISDQSSTDAFVAKFDSSGNVIWAESLGGLGSSWGNGIGVDQNNNVYIAGEFYGSLTLGSFTLTNTDLSAQDIFVAKYDDQGNVLWAKSAGGSWVDEVTSLSADPNGNVYITGQFRSPTITFGPTTLVNTNGSSDIFIARYNRDGILKWAKRAGGAKYDYGADVSSDDNYVYVTGSFTDPYLVFEGDTIPGLGQANTTFVFKLDTMGDVIWAKSMDGNPGSSRGYSITNDAEGNVLVTGYFLGSLIAGNTTLVDVGPGGDLYVVAYHSSGAVLNAISAEGPGIYNVQSISIDPSGNVYVAGSFKLDTLKFDSIVVTNSVIGGIYHDIFIAKLSISLVLSVSQSFSSDLDATFYPNPAHQVVNIDLGAPYAKINVEVIDVVGQLVLRQRFDYSQHFTIDLSEIRSGIYFIRINSADKSSILKIIKG